MLLFNNDFRLPVSPGDIWMKDMDGTRYNQDNLGAQAENKDWASCIPRGETMPRGGVRHDKKEEKHIDYACEDMFGIRTC